MDEELPPRHVEAPPQPPSEVTRPAWTWRRLDPPEDPRQAPCQRSLHVAAVWRDSMFIIGGYDGNTRVNDFFRYDFRTKRWSMVPISSGEPPSPRDRHTAVVHKDSFYVFGGFDGTSRVNDFHQYSFLRQSWGCVAPSHGTPPSPRHSHATVVARLREERDGSVRTARRHGRADAGCGRCGLRGCVEKPTTHAHGGHGHAHTCGGPAGCDSSGPQRCASTAVERALEQQSR